MEIQLDRDLIFFDIEATGLNVIRDRIVQIALIKYFKNGNPPEEKCLMINPGVPISEEAMAIHKITPEMVKNKPTFIQVADELFEFIGDADLGGYNSDRYDIPMLMEEFSRAGKVLDVGVRRTVDVQKIFYKMEPRTLMAAYRLYCGKHLEGAHDALADVKATVDVLEGMMTKYDGVEYIDGDGFSHPAPIKRNVEDLAKFTSESRMVDATQRLKYDMHGTIVFNFGKYVGKPVAETLYRDKQYYHWILEKEFSAQVKQIVHKLVGDKIKMEQAKKREG